jgi:L-ascorbate metabolism protein UlaG (beta-lactamase superfamily)
MSQSENKITFLGHASIKIHFMGKTIYIDPFGGDEKDYSEKADLILITHGHRDHSDPDKIKLINVEKTIILTSKNNAPNLEGNVKVLEPGQEEIFDDITIQGVAGYNTHRFRSKGVPYHPKEIQTAFLIKGKDHAIYHAGDTDFIDEMKELQDISIAFLPIGGKYTMDIPEAVEAAIEIAPKIVVPIHSRSKKPKNFQKKMTKKKAKTNVKILEKGESFAI